MEPCDMLIRKANILLPDMAIASNQTIAVKDSKIIFVGKEEACEWTEADVTIENSHLLWMPGLTDAHLHTSQQLLKGSLLDEKPVIWKRINVPFEASLTDETMALSAQLAGIEMIKSGTTSFVDAGGPHIEAAAEEYCKMGMRGAVTWQTTDGAKVPDRLRVETERAVPRLEALYRQYQGKDGLLSVYYSVTSLMACTEELFRSVFAAAKEKHVPAECHMNEYTSEIFDFIERYQERPFEYLDRAGVLPDDFVAAHCIMLSESEIEILQDKKIRVVHCPFSNCGKGVPPTPRLLAAKIPVAFGSDGAGHGGLDLFREMRSFRCVMNATLGIAGGNPRIMPSETLLSMACNGGASALMREDIGALSVGNAADMIAIDFDKPHLMPTSNMIHTLIESASGADVTHSVINGRLVMKDRRLLTIDEESVLHRARQMMKSHPFFTKEGAYCGFA